MPIDELDTNFMLKTLCPLQEDLIYPLFSINFSGNKYIQEVFENVYKVVMKLTIVDVDIDDFGQFKCVAKNSLGETDGSIKLYRKYWYMFL